MAFFVQETPEKLAQLLVLDFKQRIYRLAQEKDRITLVISGGTTPAIFFEQLARHHQIPPFPVNWKKIHLFWADERCVPPDDPESNFGMTRDCLLEAIPLREEQIHRIRGENDPVSEAVRYANEICHFANLLDGMPVFDWIFLGLGEDGHTASLFPDRPDLLKSDHICEAVIHPVTRQSRVTLTGPVLIRAKRITFLVTGKAKNRIIDQIIHKTPETGGYPASHIIPLDGMVDWYFDQAAAGSLNPENCDQ